VAGFYPLGTPPLPCHSSKDLEEIKMEAVVCLSKADMEALFDKWNKDSEKNGWEKNPFDPKAQAEHFFEEAEAYLAAKPEN
jgi:hypothetical protein